MTFGEWLENAKQKRIKRMCDSIRWRWFGSWPIMAMEVGWRAHIAAERLKRRLGK